MVLVELEPRRRRGDARRQALGGSAVEAVLAGRARVLPLLSDLLPSYMAMASEKPASFSPSREPPSSGQPFQGLSHVCSLGPRAGPAAAARWSRAPGQFSFPVSPCSQLTNLAVGKSGVPSVNSGTRAGWHWSESLHAHSHPGYLLERVALC